MKVLNGRTKLGQKVDRTKCGHIYKISLVFCYTKDRTRAHTDIMVACWYSFIFHTDAAAACIKSPIYADISQKSGNCNKN